MKTAVDEVKAALWHLHEALSALDKAPATAAAKLRAVERIKVVAPALRAKLKDMPTDQRLLTIEALNLLERVYSGVDPVRVDPKEG